MAKHRSNAQTTLFKLPAVVASSFDPQLVLEQEADNRFLFLNATLFSAAGNNVKVAPPATVVPLGGIEMPHITIGFDQGRLSSGQDANGHNITLDTPYLIDVPKGERVYAILHGTNMGLALLVGGSVRLSATSAPLLEASINGQSERLIKGFEDAMRRVHTDFLPELTRLLASKR